MAFNFPEAPTEGQEFTPAGSGPTYIYKSPRWWLKQNVQLITTGDTPPANPINGDFWWESDTGNLHIWYVDVDTQQWVQVNYGPQGIQGIQGPQGLQGEIGSTGVWAGPPYKLMGFTYDSAAMAEASVMSGKIGFNAPTTDPWNITQIWMSKTLDDAAITIASRHAAAMFVVGDHIYIQDVADRTKSIEFLVVDSITPSTDTMRMDVEYWDDTGSVIVDGAQVFLIGYTHATQFVSKSGDSMSGSLTPNVTGTLDLGSAALRWATVFTSDLSLNNGVGDWTIVEGEDDLFIFNNKKGKTYKFALVEVDPSIVPLKKD